MGKTSKLLHAQPLLVTRDVVSYHKLREIAETQYVRKCTLYGCSRDHVFWWVAGTAPTCTSTTARLHRHFHAPEPR